MLEAGLDNLRRKSEQQSEYLIALWQALLEPLGFTLNSPRDVQQRGSHVSLGHTEGLRIDLALLAENILPDFRVPDNIRLGLAPLYISFHDIYTTITRLQQIVEQRLYEKYSTEIPIVT